MSKVRGGGPECQAVMAQEQQRGKSPHLRSSGCMGTGGLRGATPRSRSGGVVVRKYSSSKVRENPSKMVGVVRGHQRADILKP